MILLINPRTTLNSQNVEEYFREPNTGILYLAAILDLHRHYVDILDLEQYPNLTNIQLKKIIENCVSKYEIFGITALTNTFHLTLKIASMIKKSDSNKIVIIGGPHASFLYDEILKLNYNGINFFDFVCVGEAEHSFLNLIRFISNSRENLKSIKK